MSDIVEPLKLPLHPIIRTRLIKLMGENETLQYEIEKLRAALIEINELNSKRLGYSKKIERVIWKALGEKE